MNIAIIFAGGTGQRMNSRTRPKQFLELHNKPIIIYTIEQFEKHPMIDAIVVVCLAGWEDYLQQLLNRFYIKKVGAIVTGGQTGQESIYLGISKARELYGTENIVLIHDGVRPLVEEETITKNVQAVNDHGNAITVSSATETIVVNNIKEENRVETIIDRQKCRYAKAPQSFYIEDIYSAHVRAIEDGKRDFIDSASMMLYYGNTLYTVEGTTTNIKITTPTDYYMFRAIIDAKENQQILGV